MNATEITPLNGEISYYRSSYTDKRNTPVKDVTTLGPFAVSWGCGSAFLGFGVAGMAASVTLMIAGLVGNADVAKVLAITVLVCSAVGIAATCVYGFVKRRKMHSAPIYVQYHI